jgi:hypothetical protein
MFRLGVVLHFSATLPGVQSCVANRRAFISRRISDVHFQHDPSEYLTAGFSFKKVRNDGF